MQNLSSPIPQSFKITNQYVWLPHIYALPARISYDVTCENERDEFIPCFSFTKAQWGSPECDALSWYASPHRDDFTFRTNLFGKFPTVKRLSPSWRPTVGEKFRMSCEITTTSATYSINGIDYATATYNEGDVPNRGYFGFAKYGDVNITVENVYVDSRHVFTQVQWDNYKSHFHSDEKIQAVTFEELLENTDGGKVDWENPPIAGGRGLEVQTLAVVNECELQIGYVIFDAICLAVGAVGLRAGVNRVTAEAIAKAARPVLPRIQVIIARIAAEGATYTEMAKGVFDILRVIWSGGMLGAVLGAFTNSLTWYYALLYGATALGTIVAAFATDGLAFVAEVSIELATFGFLVADSVNALKQCS